MARRNKTFIFKRIVALCLTSVLVLAAGMSPVQASSVANQSTDGGSINNSQGKIGGDPHSKKNYNYTLAPGSNLYSEWNYKVFWPNDDVKFTTASNKQTDPTSGEEYSIVYEIKYENDKTSLKASDSAYNGPYYLKYKEVNDPPYEEGTNQKVITVTIIRVYFPSEYRVINYTLEEASKDEVAPEVVLSALENYEKVYASEAEQKYTLIYPRKIGYKFNYKCTGSGATIEDKKTLVVKPLTNAEYGDINIELEWGEEAIRIHFDANGGRLWENGLEEQTVPWMVNVHKLEEYYTPVKANAKFLGWKCDGKMVTDVKDIAPNDEDLYNFTAVWDDDEDGPAEVVFDKTGYLGVDGDYESVKWGYNEEKKLLVISGKGATRDFAGGATSRDYNPWIAPKLDIEKVVVENGITAIGAYTFMECDTIKSIELPSTVKKIGKSAFNSCGKLASINIPSGVTKILDATFAGCSQLKTLELPKKLTVIEGFAFSGCSSLTKITIPDTVTSIGNQAFEDCNSLTSITIPKNVKSVGEQAFFSCKKLKTVKLLCKAPTLTSTFENCTALTSVTVPATAKVLNHTFLGCKNLTKVTLKSGIQKLNGTFGNCTKLKSLTIPSSVTTLNSPVYGCKNLKTITIKSKKLTSKTINKGVWKNLNKKLVIKVPKDKLKAYKALFKKKGFKGSIKAI